MSHGTQSVDIPFRVTACTLERNNHLAADSVRISAEYGDLNIDPRMLKNATIQVWIGQANANDVFTRTDDNLRFVGIVQSCNRKSVEDGLTVEIEAHDYTSLFLAQKPFPTLGIPTYNSTLVDAWGRICDYTGFWDVNTGKMISNVAALRGQLRVAPQADIDLSRIVGEGIPKRLGDYGKLSVKTGDSAWDVWQRTVMSLGLISYIEKDVCYITTTTEHYAAGNAPQLIYGLNILECDEVADTKIGNKGIGLVAYDHLTGNTIEAYYPIPGDVRINTKRAIARKQAKGKLSNDFVQSESYDVYEYHDVTDPAVLLKIAERAYAERSRQEIQGYVKTVEMFAYLTDGTKVDLLDLSAGDNIRIEIEPQNLELIKNIGDMGLRVQRLIEIGYDPDVAKLLARNLDALTGFEPVFHTASVVTTLTSDSYDTTIKYHNKIYPIGASTDDESSGKSPLPSVSPTGRKQAPETPSKYSSTNRSDNSNNKGDAKAKTIHTKEPGVIDQARDAVDGAIRIGGAMRDGDLDFLPSI